jgi:transposase InsO family protein
MTRVSSKGHSLKSVCDLVGISRQAYYKRKSKQAIRNDLYNSVEQVVIDNRKVKSRAGLRSIYHKENMSTLLGINKFEQQMSMRGLALKPYKSYIKTTDSRGHYYKYDNLISGLEITEENKVIVGDITYYQNATGLYYIFHFKDYYTLETKGLLGSKNMEGINAERCLRQVFAYNAQSKYNYGMILHTDAGSQYRSHKFQKMLRTAQIRPSHAKSCFENGLSERENGILKNEYLIDYNIKSVTQLNRVLKKVQFSINNTWPSGRLGYKTPRQFAQWLRKIEIDKRPVKIVKIVQ